MKFFALFSAVPQALLIAVSFASHMFCTPQLNEAFKRFPDKLNHLKNIVTFKIAVLFDKLFDSANNWWFVIIPSSILFLFIVKFFMRKLETDIQIVIFILFLSFFSLFSLLDITSQMLNQTLLIAELSSLTK
ncbi:MAG: hypothetical protein HQM10_17850 [Candidatus Riflebacteria bacterium]|nr:hypothetical protein [Candidatus Riflebacteria bacterium]